MEINSHSFSFSIFFLHYLMVCLTINANTNITTDKHALLSLKSKISFDPQNILANNWSVNSTSPCNWVGVTCSSHHNRVIGLDLSNMNLVGELTPDLGNLEFLVSLNLTKNYFRNSFPQELSQLQHLKTLQCSRNEFSGNIPSWLGLLSKLQLLDLHNNHLIGAIPKEIGNLTTLQFLHFGGNHLGGVIPRELGKLHMLQYINLEFANLSGSIPKEIFNISSLQSILFVSNQLVGSLPKSIGHALPDLQQLYVGDNFLSGVIPHSISNCSKLTVLSLEFNQFSGTLPTFLGNLRFLQQLHLHANALTNGAISPELSIINSLINCNYLRKVRLDENPLHAILPASIGNLSSSLEVLSISECGLNGIIPNRLENLTGLIILNLDINNLTGFLPPMLGRVQKLQRLKLRYNKLSGPIPHSLCKLQYLGELYLSNNQFSSLPKCFGNITSLIKLYLGSNRLSSKIPSSLFYLRGLLKLDLNSNFLDGFIPIEIEDLKALYFLDMSNNEISGNIPGTIGQLQTLEFLSLARNRLQGFIPENISKIVSLEFLDLSMNKLCGSIPISLETLAYLKQFNVSFNELSGEIPSSGCFKYFTNESFMFNEGLCGISKFNVPSCHVGHHSRINSRLLVALTSIGVALIIAFAIIALIFARQQKKHGVPNVMDIHIPMENTRISYYDLSRVTCGFSQNNLIGKGSYGSVYKGIMNDGVLVAVKVFNQSEDALRSFDVECEVLKNLRHRNLTKVITGCFTHNFKALVLEYMSNGSLDHWLHSQRNFLDIIQRLNIMIDVACALEYLHHGYTIPIVHCDLKPSNVLLDDELVAHVSDFSVTKLLTENESSTQTKTLATLGYMAPEYGSTGMVSTQCDVYSFGIVVMETFSKRKPTDETFSENMSLKKWIRDSIPHRILQVIDPNLLHIENRDFSTKVQCVCSILELALQCAMELPEMRLNMRDVVARLNKIKSNFIF